MAQIERCCHLLLLVSLIAVFVVQGQRPASGAVTANEVKITMIDPPEKEFFAKKLDFHGIPIKAHEVVSNEAIYAAYHRLSMLFSNLLTKQPMLISNMVAAGDVA